MVTVSSQGIGAGKMEYRSERFEQEHLARSKALGRGGKHLGLYGKPDVVSRGWRGNTGKARADGIRGQIPQRTAAASARVRERDALHSRRRDRGLPGGCRPEARARRLPVYPDGRTACLVHTHAEIADAHHGRAGFFGSLFQGNGPSHRRYVPSVRTIDIRPIRSTTRDGGRKEIWHQDTYAGGNAPRVAQVSRVCGGPLQMM